MFQVFPGLVTNIAALSGSGGGGGGLLDGSESDGTNLFTGGDLAFTSGWGALDVTKTANNATDPAGGSAAATVRESATTTRHGLYIQRAITAGAAYNWSIYAKSVTRQYMQLFLASSGGSTRIYAYFDLINGTVTDYGILSSSGSSMGTPTIQAAVNGFYKCTMPSVVIDGTDANPYYQPMCSDNATYGGSLALNSPSFLGVAGNGLNLWRPKVAA